MRADTAPSDTRVAGVLGALIAMAVIGSSAVAVAVPDVREELGLSVSEAAWIFSVFSLAFAVATAVFGRLADLYGLRAPMVAGITAMGIGSMLAAFAPDLGVLLVGRVLQGAGSGAVPVLANGLIAARYQGTKRARMLGVTFSVVAVVSGAGPVIGGTVTELLGWRWILAFPISAWLLVPLILPLAPAERTPGRFDRLGAALTALAVGGLLLLLQAPTAGASAAVTGAACVLVGGPLLVRHVRGRPGGFLPTVVIGNPTLQRVAVGGLLLLAGYFAALLATPVLLADTQGWSALQIGLALLPAAAAGGLGSRVIGSRLGPSNQFRLATVVAALSGTGLLVAGLTGSVPAALVVGLACASIGFSGGSVALVDRATETAPPGTLGVTLGVVNMVHFTGGGIGTALLGGLSGVVTLPIGLAICAALPLGGAALLATAGRHQVPSAAPTGPGQVG